MDTGVMIAVWGGVDGWCICSCSWLSVCWTWQQHLIPWTMVCLSNALDCVASLWPGFSHIVFVRQSFSYCVRQWRVVLSCHSAFGPTRISNRTVTVHYVQCESRWLCGPSWVTFHSSTLMIDSLTTVVTCHQLLHDSNTASLTVNWLELNSEKTQLLWTGINYELLYNLSLLGAWCTWSRHCSCQSTISSDLTGSGELCLQCLCIQLSPVTAVSLHSMITQLRVGCDTRSCFVLQSSLEHRRL